MSIKAHAETFRLALILGLVEPFDVIQWADREVMTEAASEVPALLDISLAAHRPVAELTSLLSAVPGDANRSVVGRYLAAQLLDGLKSGRLDIVTVARAMFRLLHEGYAPDSEFENMAYVADDGVDLALQQTYGTLEEVHLDVLRFLERYANANPSSSSPAA